MSVEWLDGKWYITTACPEPHEDGKPCASCWPDSHDHPPPHEHEQAPDSPSDGDRFTCGCGYSAEFVALNDGRPGEWVSTP